MQEQGILSYVPKIDTGKLGYNLFVYLAVSVVNISVDEEKSFVSFLTMHPNVTYCAKTSGKWDFIVSIVAEDYQHFDKVLREIRRKFSDSIQYFDTTPVIETFKYDEYSGLIEHLP